MYTVTLKMFETKMDKIFQMVYIKKNQKQSIQTDSLKMYLTDMIE